MFVGVHGIVVAVHRFQRKPHAVERAGGEVFVLQPQRHAQGFAVFGQGAVVLVQTEIGTAQVHVGGRQGDLVAQLRSAVKGGQKMVEGAARFVQYTVGCAQVGENVGQFGQQVALVKDRPRPFEPLDCLRQPVQEEHLPANVHQEPGIVAHILQPQCGQCTYRQPADDAGWVAPKSIVGQRQGILACQAQIVVRCGLGGHARHGNRVERRVSNEFQRTVLVQILDPPRTPVGAHIDIAPVPVHFGPAMQRQPLIALHPGHIERSMLADPTLRPA